MLMLGGLVEAHERGLDEISQNFQLGKGGRLAQ